MPHAASRLIALFAVAGLATAAAGQAEPHAEPEAEAQAGAPAPPLLSGPEVRDERLPGAESSFSEAPGAMSRYADRTVPPRAFRRALGELSAPDAPENIRLSGAQRDRIGGLVRAYEREVAEFRRTHADELRALRSAGRRGERGADGGDRPRPPRSRAERSRPADAQPGEMEAPREAQRPGDRAPARTAAGNPSAPEGLRERARELRAMMPSPVDTQNKIWAELNDDQRAHLEAVLERFSAQRDQQAEQRDRERYRKQIGDRFAEMPDAPAGDATELRRWFEAQPEDVRQRVRQRLEAIPAERREQLVQRLQQMSPEQRQRLLRRLQAAQSEDRPPRRRPN
ncbi:MAG: hypothetical protein AAFX79_10020 [Planctomycetota bacterium]